MNYKDYPKNWKFISKEIRERSNGRCECDGICGLHNGQDLIDTYNGRCRELNGSAGLFMRGKVVLTVAHLCHKPKCARRAHLRAMCQRCHLRYDMEHHIINRKKKLK